ncbi:MAG: AgmX/PglI C-terminal domain-containing protein [Deltaproteobacteria bacterium]|nr:AgmX/PglI C-terminal domain-containing protein [Deltaproteobacteria bacterium]
MHRRIVALAAVVTGTVAAGACGTPEGMVAIDPSQRQTPTADIAELEIRGMENGVDRYVTCPPPGELGQPWFPNAPAWTPPATTDAGAPIPIDEDFISKTKGRSMTELAVDATHRDFRACYRRGLVHDPTQEGRVAIVIRIGPDGRVAKVEELGACAIAVESIACMKSTAGRLRFPPPANGSETVTIPSVFTARDGVRRSATSANDTYTAGAFVTLETARPGLHACEQAARRDHRNLEATGTFTMTLGPDGKVTRAHVDPWTGEQSILMCAAQELEKLRFSAPPSGTGTIIARLNFNPRQGTR